MTTPLLRGIARLHLVTLDLRNLVRFYEEVLGFSVEGQAGAIDEGEMALLGLTGSGVRQNMRLGNGLIAIEEFDCVGRPYPSGSNAASLDFQHIAIPVADMSEAYSRLHDAVPISLDGPSQLPASSGGVCAFKFRDPDGHPLEFLQFPSSGPKRWVGAVPRASGTGLGIDHSAISVSEVSVSVEFYRDLGLEAAEHSHNSGPAQEALDGLDGVEVDVQALKPPDATPHLELLAYRRPRGAPAPTTRPNDVVATRIGWLGSAVALLRDPDGHFHQVGPWTSDR